MLSKKRGESPSVTHTQKRMRFLFLMCALEITHISESVHPLRRPKFFNFIRLYSKFERKIKHQCPEQLS